ncbi:hypothetical protein SHLI107390_02825 [Shewanella livingstonensis]
MFNFDVFARLMCEMSFELQLKMNCLEIIIVTKVWIYS